MNSTESTMTDWFTSCHNVKKPNMKTLDWSYELHVLGTSKKALSLDDFAELAKRLAELLGSREHVRFGALRDGSARILAKVLEPAVQDVEVQLLRAKNDDGPGANKVVRINDYLAQKGWRGELKNRQGGVVLSFLGAPKKLPIEPVQKIEQLDSIIGQVIKIGGRDETVPMTIRTPEGAFVDVTVKGREQAKKLAQHLFGSDLKLFGNATWIRDELGHWSCNDLVVLSFEETDASSLIDLFASLQRVTKNQWNEMEDPISEWKKHREDH